MVHEFYFNDLKTYSVKSTEAKSSFDLLSSHNEYVVK